MKKLLAYFSILMIGTVLIFSSCKKEDDPVPPKNTFSTTTGYVSSDASFAYGDTIMFGLNAASNGTDPIVKFQIFFNGYTILDSTVNTQNFTLDFYTTKTVLDKEVWKFVTTDLAGNSDTDSITITGNFGDIFSYPSVTIGAQANTSDKGFVSYSNSTFTGYSQAEAFLHQEDVDMFCFYENDPPSHVNLMTLAAPGSNISGIFTGDDVPANYTTKNLTFFVKTELTAAEFDLIGNDALILASYDPDNQFKKAKQLTAGDVYAFKLQSGKYGMFKVTAVTGETEGSVQIAVKIQK